MSWPDECPNRINKFDADWCGAWGRPGAVCLEKWDVGPCHVCLGEWGAWRSDGGLITRAWGVAEDMAPVGMLNLDSAAFMVALAYKPLLDAAGWSP